MALGDNHLLLPSSFLKDLSHVSINQADENRKFQLGRVVRVYVEKEKKWKKSN
jgi:hypothetical protein